MNVAFATDERYAQHCLVALTSLAEHNDGLNVYIITTGLSPKVVSYFNDNSAKYRYTLNWIHIPVSFVSKLPLPSRENIKHISLATYYRLFIAELLPLEIDKILYLDCDIVVMGPLKNLWELKIDNYALAACDPLDKTFAIENRVYERLSIPLQYGYFNAGVLLINIEYWRTKNVQQWLLQFAESKFNNIIYHDQDILNAVLYDQVLFFEERFNMQRTHDINENDEAFWNAAIVHFSSSPKPWDYGCQHLLSNYYYKTLQKTPYRDFSPSFNYKNWWRYVAKPSIKTIIKELK